MPGFWVLGIVLAIALTTLVLFLISWGCAALGMSIEEHFERRRVCHLVQTGHPHHLHHRMHIPPGIQLM
jgi:hypothetical protein